ncbi:MAG: DEAD/DEAH box helicase [Planctomycetes bacterium]|nr:DEAD/DEAH box helicase [Planctomycetota bacterium]
MANDFDEGTLRHWRGFQLNRFQVEAIAALRAGKNVLVGAPTGAGKTLVAEYAIEAAVERRRRCVYTSPIKALSNQKFRDFRAQGIDVGLLTGDITLHPRAQVLIMTTEILRNAIFENPRELEDVEFAVFDEVHFLDDPLRGSVWEEALIFAPPSMRFLCLSATIPNIHELGQWLAEIRPQALQVVESSARPVPLHHRLFLPLVGTQEARDVARLRREAKHGAFDESGRARRRHGRSARDSRGRRPRPTDPALRTEMLLDELELQHLLPVLVFAFSRKDCERLARRNAKRTLLSPTETSAMVALQKELVRAFQLPEGELDGELLAMGRRGVGYHHAGLLPIHKELVERMFTSGLLRMLFTTETFALGINMPARTVVFHALEKFDGVGIQWLRCREYMQMAGRAGRQGIDSEGLVYSVVDERALSEAPLERIFADRPEAVFSRFQLSYSSLLHLVPTLGRERVHQAWEKSFNQYQSRANSPKAQEKNRRRQRGMAEAHLAVLEQLGYLEQGDQPTPRGRVARVINGFELQATELLFQGVLEQLSSEALAVVFVALIHEDRRRGFGGRRPEPNFQDLPRRVARTLARVSAIEAENGVETPLKLPDFGLTQVVLAWCKGAAIEEAAELSESSAGDICRTLRMAIQLMREVRHAIDPSWDLRERLASAIELVNRDEVDARRQLEIG